MCVLSCPKWPYVRVGTLFTEGFFEELFEIANIY